MGPISENFKVSDITGKLSRGRNIKRFHKKKTHSLNRLIQHIQIDDEARKITYMSIKKTEKNSQY